MPLLEPTILFATPLLIAALGELVAERSGLVNIGIEGMMLAGALGAYLANSAGGAAAGLAGGAAAGAALALGFAAVVLLFSADQIVAGTGVNLLSLGATGLVYRHLLDAGLLRDERIVVTSPFVLAAAVPVLAAGIALFLTRTRPGLELTAAGEGPAAADAAGVPVLRRRLYAALFGGACAGLAGAYLSTSRVAHFSENMTAGQGFLALAIVIFGRWNAAGVVLAGLFFGLARAAADRLALSDRFAGPAAESLLKALPYVLSLLALALMTGRSTSPAALGRPYVRE